jgi:hypothetical protein
MQLMLLDAPLDIHLELYLEKEERFTSLLVQILMNMKLLFII